MADPQVNDEVSGDSERRLNRLHSDFSHLNSQKKLLTTIESVGGMVTDTRKAGDP